MNAFQVITKLGEGAYSIVYKVKRLVDGNIYALKKVKLLNLSEKEKLNALNEVRILASVKSSFVISYKEAFYDEKDSTLGIVMEYADKTDLYQKIVEHKKSAMFFEETDIWRILIQLIKGLKALHELKILHRDMKSANVFLFSDGSAKLGDLNVSKVARKGLGYTQTGTPYYASPEVWKDQPYDSKSDIWSLGCVLYEMITLKPPFRAENMEGLYNKVIKGQLSKIPERFSSDLQTIVTYLIQVDPNHRPSCEQILKNPIIKKRIEYFKAYANDDASEDQALLQTIRIPKNLLFLSDKLPQPNYDKQIMKNYHSFPSNNELIEMPHSKIKKLTHDESLPKTINNNNNSKEEREKSEVINNQLSKSNSNEHIQREKSPKLRVVNQNLKSSHKSIDNDIEYKKMELPQLSPLSIISKRNLEPSSKRKIIHPNPNFHPTDHQVYNLYKMYVPYHNSKNKQRSLDNRHINLNNHLNIEKYYDNLNLRSKSKNYGQNLPNIKVIPKRKLSPIRRNGMNSNY